MKRGAFIFLFFLAVSAIRAQPAMEFEKVEQHVGEIVKKGGKVACEYTFVNSGDEPLVILEAQGSCDCTEISYPQEPVMPGRTAAVTVRYNPRKQPPGKVYKTIRILTNNPEGRYILIFAGTII